MTKRCIWGQEKSLLSQEKKNTYLRRVISVKREKERPINRREGLDEHEVGIVGLMNWRAHKLEWSSSSKLSKSASSSRRALPMLLDRIGLAKLSELKPSRSTNRHCGSSTPIVHWASCIIYLRIAKYGLILVERRIYTDLLRARIDYIQTSLYRVLDVLTASRRPVDT